MNRKQEVLSSPNVAIEDLGPSNELNRYRTKIALLEIREKNAMKKIDTLIMQLKNNEDLISELNNYIKDLEGNLLKMNEQYYEERENNIRLTEKTSGSIGKKEAELLKLDSDRY